MGDTDLEIYLILYEKVEERRSWFVANLPATFSVPASRFAFRGEGVFAPKLLFNRSRDDCSF